VPDPTPTPAGWFPDPLGRYDHRYFNGSTWTPDVSTGGQRFVDPLGTGPNAPHYRSTSTSNGAATAAVVMGSIALAIAWIPFVVVIGAVLAILAIVFGSIGLGRSSRTTGVGRKSSIAGLIMGSLGMVAVVVGAILTVAVFREVVRFIEPGEHEATVDACDLDGRQAEVTGSISNLDDERRAYTVFVEIADRTRVVSVDEIDPGDTATWSTVVTLSAALSECEPEITVQGPFPYGIELDPVDS
jgi:Protein of unknown function (DUF2510)